MDRIDSLFLRTILMSQNLQIRLTSRGELAMSGERLVYHFRAEFFENFFYVSRGRDVEVARPDSQTARYVQRMVSVCQIRRFYTSNVERLGVLSDMS